MRSVRLDDQLEDRVRRAAQAEHESVSEFLRKAAAERADSILAVVDGGMTNSERLANVIGSVHGKGGGDATSVHEAFGEIVQAKQARLRRKAP